jgi:hypothetical protein
MSGKLSVRVEGLTEATRSALFVLAAAADAGFSFRAAGAGRLEVRGPIGMPDELCEPTIAAVRTHGAEILRLIRWLNSEADQGRFWSPRPGPEARQ